MESFLFAANAVLPITLSVLVGYFLKRVGILPVSIAKPMNRLVFYLLLPSMLFLNVYNIDTEKTTNVIHVVYAVGATIIIFLISLPLICALVKVNERRGVILQGAFRSNNALIGVALAESLCGSDGAKAAALASAAVIPLFNVLSVISLSIFNKQNKKVSIRSILKDIIQNPLIISIAAALVCLFIRPFLTDFNISFRLTDLDPLMKTLQYFSNAATPVALLTLGAGFEFSAVAELKKEIILGTSLRIGFSPLLAIGCALLFKDYFDPAHFAVFVSFFSTPVAVTSVAMTQEMNGDTKLAGQLVVWTTILSAFSVFLAVYLLKSIGIFV